MKRSDECARFRDGADCYRAHMSDEDTIMRRVAVDGCHP
jgi:hypothetical protein